MHAECGKMSPLFWTCTLTTTSSAESADVVGCAIASSIQLRRAFTMWTERCVGNPARPHVSDKSVLFPRHTPPRAGPRPLQACSCVDALGLGSVTIPVSLQTRHTLAWPCAALGAKHRTHIYSLFVHIVMAREYECKNTKNSSELYFPTVQIPSVYSTNSPNCVRYCDQSTGSCLVYMWTTDADHVRCHHRGRVCPCSWTRCGALHMPCTGS